VPSAQVDREDGIGPGSYYDEPHYGVIPNADDDRPMQGPGNGSCAMSIIQETHKRKKGGNRHGSAHPKQLSYPVSDP